MTTHPTVPRNGAQVARVPAQRGLKFGGTAKQSGKHTGLSTTDVAITFDATSFAGTDAAAQKHNPANLNIWVESAADLGNKVAFRWTTSEGGNTATTDGYSTNNGILIIPCIGLIAGGHTIYLRTETATDGIVHYWFNSY